jgi:hypothetical protein
MEQEVLLLQLEHLIFKKFSGLFNLVFAVSHQNNLFFVILKLENLLILSLDGCLKPFNLDILVLVNNISAIQLFNNVDLRRKTVVPLQHLVRV